MSSDIKISIIDYGMGNLRSVANAFKAVDCTVEVTDAPSALRKTDGIVLPGVGAFGDAMSRLRDKGFVEVLNDEVLSRKKPILGICLGMQLFAKWGNETGEREGLGWIDARVVKIKPEDANLRIPHVGWNELSTRGEAPLFSEIPQSTAVYFVHSYHMRLESDPAAEIIATCDYGGSINAAVQKNNIHGVQFHPEKSQQAGLQILKNFVRPPVRQGISTDIFSADSQLKSKIRENNYVTAVS